MTAIVVVLALAMLSGGQAKPTPPIRRRKLNEQGWKLWQEAKARRSGGQIRGSRESRSENVNAWNGLGWSQFNQGKSDDALKSFNKAIEIEPDIPRRSMASGRFITRRTISTTPRNFS